MSTTDASQKAAAGTLLNGALARYGQAALGGLALALILIAGAMLYASGGQNSRDIVANQLLISAVMVIGLQVFIGNTGVMSFGHMGFATIAGYVVALLIMPVDRKVRQIADAPFGLVEAQATPLVATLIAVGVVILIALLLGLALSRPGQGAFAATIITLALLEIVHEAALGWNDLTDGGTGLGFIPKMQNRIPIFVVLIITLVGARVFSETYTGRWAKAAREDDVAANILGIDIKFPRVIALVLSVVIVAMGASLRVQDVGAMTPRLMFFDYTLLILAMLIVGGRRTVTGAILGVVLIFVGNEVARLTGSHWGDGVIPGFGWLFRPTLPQLFLGAAMLGMMLLKPEGLIKDWEIDHIFRDRLRKNEDKPVSKGLNTVAITEQATHTLKVDDLSVAYEGFIAVNNVSIEVHSNEIVGLIGPNGAGKTTLLNAITAFTHTTRGTVTLDGELLSGKPAYQIAKAGISRTFQNLRLFNGLSVKENIAVAAITQPETDPNARTDDLLNFSGLWDQRYVRANELDYGNQRRLELARAAAGYPTFLLLDEPTSGMSDEESLKMVEHIRQVADSVSAGVLVIDHDLGFIMQICDRVYVLNYGTLLASGTPQEIRANEDVREAYLGSQA